VRKKEAVQSGHVGTYTTGGKKNPTVQKKERTTQNFLINWVTRMRGKGGKFAGKEKTGLSQVVQSA